MRRISTFLLAVILLAIAAAPLAAAPRLAPEPIFDAPFVGSVAAVAIGDVLFVAGENQAGNAGLAVYTRDPATAALALEGTYDYHALGLRSVAALAASPDGKFLYAFGEGSLAGGLVAIVGLGPDGLPLPGVATTSLFSTFDAPRDLAISPDGKNAYVSSSQRLLVCDRDLATGRLTVKQTIAGSSFDRLLLPPNGSRLYAAGEVLALRAFLRQADGQLSPQATFDDFAAFGLTVQAGLDLAQSPNGRYLYLLGRDRSGPETAYAVLAFDSDGGQLVLQSRGPGSGGQTVAHAIEVNPRNGSLYLATFNEDENLARVAAFPPKEGGRDFEGLANAAVATGVRGYENYPLALAASADGDLLAAGSFDGLPISSFLTAGPAGALVRETSGSGGSSMAELRDLTVSPSGGRVLVAAPVAGRVGALAWDGAPQLVNAAKPGSALAIERLEFLDETHAAGLVSQASGAVGLHLFQVSPAGVLSSLGSFALGVASDLWASPDGSQLIVVGESGIRRFEYRAASATLVSRGFLSERGGYGPARFSADGRELLVVVNEPALVIPLYHTLPFRFDPASGTMSAETEDPDLASGALDYAFSPDGNELYVLKNGPDLDPLRVQVLRRGSGGRWTVFLQQLILDSPATRIDQPARLALDAGGRRLAVLGTADGGLFYFDRDPADGLLTAAGSEAAAISLPASPFAARVGELVFGPGGNELWLLDANASRISVRRWGCDAAEAGELCLGQNGRFRVEVDWSTAAGGRGIASRVVAPAVDSGLFYFFDPNNWEMLVKVLDACSINQRFWVFAAATTDVGYRMRVIDTRSGRAKLYRNAVGTASPAITDVQALDLCPAAGPLAAETSAPAPPAPDPAATVLRLRDRFELTVAWRTGDGGSGNAQVVPFGSADSGLFYFFSDDNWEMLVKVLDGCAINGHFWVLAAATTDVGYTLEVRDRVAGGAPRTYTNPVGRASPAILDLGAFGACAPLAETPR